MHTDDVTSQNNCSCAKCKNNFRKNKFLTIYYLFIFCVVVSIIFTKICKASYFLVIWNFSLTNVIPNVTMLKILPFIHID